MKLIYKVSELPLPKRYYLGYYLILILCGLVNLPLLLTNRRLYLESWYMGFMLRARKKYQGS